MMSLFLWVMPRRVWVGSAFRRGSLACLALAASAAAVTADEPATSRLGGLGVAMVPQDAAFLSSSLRIREQYDAIVNSNAWKSILQLPAVRRALDSLDEQRSTPGSPFSTFDTFMQLPENEDAVELLADMVATDTFVYGEPSCVSFWQLVRKLADAQQQAGVGEATDGEVDIVVESIEDEDGETELRGGAVDSVDAVRQARAVITALAGNLDLLVVPDLVWGFKTAKGDLATDQIKRLEVLATLMLQADPDLAQAVTRRKVAGGDFLTFTLDGALAPWDEIERSAVETTDDAKGVAKVFGRLKQLDVVVAIGRVGDWVIVSLGDSADHLEKLVLPNGGRKGLLTLPALAPLVEHGDKRLTGIAYMSESLCEAVNSSRSDVESLLGVVEQLDESAGVTAEAKKDFRGLAETIVDEWGKRVPEPGPWLAFSFLADRGYEGYSWNWARNQPFDGTKRLDLLEHAGGAPLGVMVSRMKNDPEGIDAAVDIIRGAWALFQKHGRPEMGIDDREKLDAFSEHVAPLGGKFAAILRDKLAKSLADGQIGLVLDSKARTKRIQGELPPSAEPLPLIEPAVVVSLADPKLFKEGLSDLFALGDDLTDALRQMDPGTVPEGYRIPEPEKSKGDEGSVWSWKLLNSRLDEQIRPTIGVGDDVAVFSMAPKQAGRMLVESRLETGSQLATFDEPLASAAAFDVAGVIDAIEPWVTYLTRYGCVQERDGAVDPDDELTAADENEQAKEVLEHVQVVLAAAKSLRAAAAETSYQGDALVTHWRNVIRDTPAK
ncbi:MAG: hypothetical protein KJS77_00850 [Planctomycetes bacterium]|nr:hypothetical protein [Planctomycetota bacterium]